MILVFYSNWPNSLKTIIIYRSVRKLLALKIHITWVELLNKRRLKNSTVVLVQCRGDKLIEKRGGVLLACNLPCQFAQTHHCIVRNSRHTVWTVSDISFCHFGQYISFLWNKMLCIRYHLRIFQQVPHRTLSL